MAKDKYTSKDQAKLNAEIQQQNKLLDSARKQVAAMGVEYDKFSEAVKSEFLPAVLIGKKAFIPERSFHTIDQANKVIRNYLLEQQNRGPRLD